MINMMIDLELDLIKDKEIIDFLNELPFDQVQDEIKKRLAQAIAIDTKKETS